MQATRKKSIRWGETSSISEVISDARREIGVDGHAATLRGDLKDSSAAAERAGPVPVHHGAGTTPSSLRSVLMKACHLKHFEDNTPPDEYAEEVSADFRSPSSPHQPSFPSPLSPLFNLSPRFNPLAASSISRLK